MGVGGGNTKVRKGAKRDKEEDEEMQRRERRLRKKMAMKILENEKVH